MSAWVVALWILSACIAAGLAIWRRRNDSALEIAGAVVSGVLSVTVLLAVAAWVASNVVLNPA